jgi:CubicO group peptidase (beta-lactamase class C family)
MKTMHVKNHTFKTLGIACLISISAVIQPRQAFSAGLEELTDSLVNTTVKPGQPGGVLGIASAGKTLFMKAYGLADVENNIPNTTLTVFNLASISKQFTAYAVLLLEQQGKLRLDDRVHDWIPEMPDYGETITLRNLIHHTSGIASTDNLRLFANIPLDEPWSQQQELDLIYKYPDLNFPPGEQYLYSNAGYSLLAEIIERVSGMSYALYLQENIFKPIGMTHAFVYDGTDNETRQKALGHQINGEEFVATKGSGETIYGATNVYASASDMIRWGQHLLSPAPGFGQFTEKLFMPTYTLNNGDTLNYTFGLVVTKYKGTTMVSHSGGDLGVRANFFLFPEHNTATFAIFNREDVNTRTLALSMSDNHLQEHLQEPVPRDRVVMQPDAELLNKYEGTFLMPDGMELTFKQERDTFWLSLPGAPEFQLFAESENHFFLKAFAAECTFVADSDGEVNDMIWHQGGKKYNATRLTDVVLPDAEELKNYAGNYYHQTLEVVYPVYWEDGSLLLNTPGTFQTFLNIGKVKLYPMGDERFATEGDVLGVLTFTRDDEGRINGFRFNDVGRLKNIRFSRID